MITLTEVTQICRSVSAAMGLPHTTPDYSKEIAAAPLENLHQWLSEGMGGPEFLDAVAAEIYARKNAGRN